MMLLGQETKDHIRGTFARNRVRIEFLDKHAVMIQRGDLDKTFILNLDTREYVVKPYEKPTASVSVNMYPPGQQPKPAVPNLVPIDPSLFEIPPGFKQVEKFQTPLSLPKKINWQLAQPIGSLPFFAGIEAHSCEALASRQAFDGMSDYDRDSVIEFLKTLQILPPRQRVSAE